MPLYEYQGKTYDLPEGLTTEQAKDKIVSFLSSQPSPKEEAQPQPEAPVQEPGWCWPLALALLCLSAALSILDGPLTHGGSMRWPVCRSLCDVLLLPADRLLGRL